MQLAAAHAKGGGAGKKNQVVQWQNQLRSSSSLAVRLTLTAPAPAPATPAHIMCGLPASRVPTYYPPGVQTS
jgi:hypothetical protein